MTSVTINLANPRKKQILATPAVVYPCGTMVDTPEVEMGVISTETLVALLKTKDCAGFHSIDRRGREKLMDPMSHVFSDELWLMKSGCGISYYCDAAEVQHRVKFNWIRLPYGWALAYNISLGLLMVDA